MQKGRLLVRLPTVPWLAKILDQGSCFTQLDLSKLHKDMLPQVFFVSCPIAKVSPLSLVSIPDTVSVNHPSKGAKMNLKHNPYLVVRLQALTSILPTDTCFQCELLSPDADARPNVRKVEPRCQYMAQTGITQEYSCSANEHFCAASKLSEAKSELFYGMFSCM